MAIKTVADLKRALKPGVTVTMVEHRFPALAGDRLVRKVQTQRFAMDPPVGHPRYEQIRDNGGSWMDIPKASEFTANPDGTVTVAPRGEFLCTLRVG